MLDGQNLGFWTSMTWGLWTSKTPGSGRPRLEVLDVHASETLDAQTLGFWTASNGPGRPEPGVLDVLNLLVLDVPTPEVWTSAANGRTSNDSRGRPTTPRGRPDPRTGRPPHSLDVQSTRWTSLEGVWASRTVPASP